VRHVRRNRAGVQFTRHQALNLKPAVTPPEVFKPASTAVTATEDRPGLSANSLVAERRRGLLRQPTADPSPTLARAPAAARTAAPEVPPVSEPPRDLSALTASLQAAALVIVEEREARRVPRPLAASRFAGAPVQPPPVAAAASAPRPFVLTGGLSVAPPPADYAKTGLVPRPLAAPRSAGAPVQPPSVAAAASVPRPFVMTRGLSVAPPPAECAMTGPVPGPLAPTAYGVAAEADADAVVASGCEAHACALGVWRRLANLPPRPLPAKAYRMPAETKVA
jgi:hypothetical protein